MAETTAQDFANALAQAAQTVSTVAPAAAVAAAAPTAPALAETNAIARIVDFDAGGNWGGETIVLKRPFKLKGVTYTMVSMRIPSGLDVTRFYSASQRPSMVDFAISLTSVAGAPIDGLVFGAMHALDAGALVKKAVAFFE